MTAKPASSVSDPHMPRREGLFESSLKTTREVGQLGLWPISAAERLQEAALRHFRGSDGEYVCDVEPYADKWEAVAQEAWGYDGGDGHCLLALDQALLELEALGYGTAHCVPVGIPRTDCFYAQKRAAGLTGFFFTRLDDVLDTIDGPATLPIYYASSIDYETPAQLKSLLEGRHHPSWNKLKVSKRHLDDVKAAKRTAARLLKKAGLEAKADPRWRHRLLVSGFCWDAPGTRLASGTKWLSRKKVASGPWGDEYGKEPRTKGLKLYQDPPRVPQPSRKELEELARSLEAQFLSGCHEQSEILAMAREQAIEEYDRKIKDAELDQVMGLLWKTYDQLAAEWPSPTTYERLVHALDSARAEGVHACHESGMTRQMAHELALMDARTESNVQGVVYYDDQSIEDCVTSGVMRIHFAALSDQRDAPPTVEIGHRVDRALQNAGFTTDWNGDASSAIRLPDLPWQRRLEKPTGKPPHKTG